MPTPAEAGTTSGRIDRSFGSTGRVQAASRFLCCADGEQVGSLIVTKTANIILAGGIGSREADATAVVTILNQRGRIIGRILASFA